MRSKLEELVMDDKDFCINALNIENGIMFNHHGEAVDYIIAEYKNKFEVYLNLYDEDEEPYRNILVKGTSPSLDVAKRIAVRKLDKFYES